MYSLRMIYRPSFSEKNFEKRKKIFFSNFSEKKNSEKIRKNDKFVCFTEWHFFTLLKLFVTFFSGSLIVNDQNTSDTQHWYRIQN